MDTSNPATVRRTVGALPTPETHRPAVGGRSTRSLGRTATLRRAVAGRLARELVTFAVIGVLSTAAYAGLYLVLRTASNPPLANALALGLTAIGNTAANRRLTFGVRDGGSMVRDQVGGLVALGVALAITTASVSVLAAVAPRAGRETELAVLLVANALATVARFVLLRSWIATDRRGALASQVQCPNTQE